MTRIFINIEADNAAEARAAMRDLLGTTALATTPRAEPTTEQVAEEAEAAPEPAAPAKPKATRARKAKDEPAPPAAVEEQPNISASPEDRQDPANPEPADSDEDAAQDAADEAAEAATDKGDAPKPTLDDVRNVLGLYVKAYGAAATQADGPILIAEVLGKKHDPEAPCKVSDIPEDRIEAAIAAIKAAGKENRFQRKQVA